MTIQINPRLSRRTVLAGAGLAAAAAGVGSLSACGGSGSAKSDVDNSAVQLPTYVQYEGITPDLPSDPATGVDAGYRTFPAENPKSVSEKPGDGSTVTGMANIYYAVPPGPDRNEWWAGLNERLGVTLDMQMVGNADYAQKFPTVIAGNDLPDLMQLVSVANFPSLLEKRFEPLSDHLAGDAIKEYPNLANIPTVHWKNAAVYNGAIYGVPIPRGIVGSYNFIRADIIEKRGLNPDPKGWDEFVELCKGLTDAKERRWALAMPGQMRQYLQRMNGEPNGWLEEGGKLTHDYETEQFKQSVADMVELWKSGVVHPDAFSPTQPFKQLFNAGTVSLNLHDGYPGWTQYILDNASNPDFKLGLMPVHTRDGAELAPWMQGNGFFSLTGISKQDNPDKVKNLLRVLNWLAAPFGTEEYKYRLYGQEGREHTVKDGNPTLTKTGVANTVVPIRYLADAPYALYQPGRPEDADTQHAYQTTVLAKSVRNPVLGIYSDTASNKNAAADKNFLDNLWEIVQGRKPIAELDTMISTWRNAVGDKMREEYQDGLQQAGGTQTPN